ncbi:MAG: DNA repair protein RecO [Thermodesulfobacteriota bacterium]|nr:DNA repair protein RecO [Thermodesulfobacteriota bacterium]
MPLYKTEAIVIRSMDFGESDKIVTFFTRDFGKLRGIAKGAKRTKKRFGGTLELFSYINLIFFDKENLGLIRINSCYSIKTYMEIFKDIQKVAYGSYFVELVSGLVGEREKNNGIFNLLIDSLSRINCQKNDEEIARIFEIRLLSLLGYEPQLEQCLICAHKLSRREKFWFSAVKGGILCNKCSHGLKRLSPISLGTLRILLFARDMDFKKIHRIVFSNQALKESEDALTDFIYYQTGKQQNSMNFIRKIKRLR